jgi:hypothetical protein
MMFDNSETDNEYSDSDVDSLEEYTTNVYEPEEPSLTKFNIALCEIHNEYLHGPGPNSQYLVYQRYKNLNMRLINSTVENITYEYNHLHNYFHPIFRNYQNIVRNNFIKPEIVECVYLSSNHCIAILKTFWIKIIQRTWKNILKKREEINKRKYRIASLRYREIYGKWPTDCNDYLPLKGMLSPLKRSLV